MMIQHNPLLEEACSFLGAIHGCLLEEEQIELRWASPDARGPMRRGFFSDPEAAAREAVSLGVRYDVYFGVAPRWGQDGTKAGVRRLPAIWADLDAKGEHTRESRHNQLKDLPHQPSILVCSGGGLHPYWLLKTPVEGAKALEQAETVMRRLGAGLAADAVWDRSRILRMPGTFNHKYGGPRTVTLEHCDPDLRYTLGQLEALAEVLPGKGRVHGGGKVSRDILNTTIEEGERNLTLASVAGSLRDRGLDGETIRAVLLEVNRLRCEPPLEEPEVFRIARSVSRYSAGTPRYRGSSARRIFSDERESR